MTFKVRHLWLGVQRTKSTNYLSLHSLCSTWDTPLTPSGSMGSWEKQASSFRGPTIAEVLLTPYLTLASKRSWSVGIIISVFTEKATELQEKFSKLSTGHTPSQWHGPEADSAGRRNRLFWYSEKVKSVMRAAHQKCHVGLLTEWEREVAELSGSPKEFQGLTSSFIHAKLRSNVYSMPLEFRLVDCIFLSVPTKSWILWGRRYLCLPWTECFLGAKCFTYFIWSHSPSSSWNVCPSVLLTQMRK